MKLYTIKEIVLITGFSESKVQRAISKGDLESRKIGGSRRIMHEWLVEWLQGIDPVKAASITIEQTVERTDKRTKTTLRIQRNDQPTLFEMT